MVRDYDSSTVDRILAAVSDWHEHAIKMGFGITNPVKLGDVPDLVRVMKQHFKKPSTNCCQHQRHVVPYDAND